MTTNIKIQEWFMICIAAALFLSMLAGFVSCANDDLEKRKQWKKQNPVQAAQERCGSKSAGSRPACWSDGDWEVYCQRVQCKTRSK